MTEKEKDLFEKYGLEVSEGAVSDLVLGEVYPIYGCITEILNDDFSAGEIRVQVNYYMDLTLSITDEAKLELVKERAFEPGIFVTKILEKVNGDGLTSTRYDEDTGLTSVHEIEDGFTVAGLCQTVIYGRPQTSGTM